MTVLDLPHSSIALTGGLVAGIPNLDQLNEPTSDAAADENTRDNCVFTCNADLSRYYHPELNANGDAVKDSIPAYGQGYVGFSSQDTIIASGALERKWGTHSWRLNAPGNSRSALLGAITTLANQGTPSIVTIPSQWGSQPSQPGYNPDSPNFYTHACVFAGTLADGTCVLCNPWGGFLMYYNQADMALRLCYLCAYPVTKASIAVAGVPGGWKDVNGILTAPNGKNVQHGFRQHILDAAAWPAALQPVGGEYGTPTRQDFALSLTWTTQANEVAGPDFAGQVAAAQAAAAQLKSQLDALKAADAAEEAGEVAAPPDPLAAEALATMKVLKGTLGKL